MGDQLGLVEPDAQAMLTSEVLGLRLSTVETPEGPRLRVDDDGKRHRLLIRSGR